MDTLSLVKRTSSLKDATKYLWRLWDGETIESVVLEHENMVCACISSQVGCPLDCVFCATGQLGFIRNLTIEEMTEQILRLENEFSKIRGTHFAFGRVLFMGMGEPLLNYQSVVDSARLIHNNSAYGHPEVFLATSGIKPDRINELAIDVPFLRLWISLCAVDDPLRTELIPAVSEVPVESILDAGDAYAEKVGHLACINYLMIDGLTDTPTCAERLVRLLKGKHFELQLTSLNSISGSSLKTSSAENIQRFAELTNHRGVPTKLFVSKGGDVMSGCGQLSASF